MPRLDHPGDEVGGVLVGFVREIGRDPAESFAMELRTDAEGGTFRHWFLDAGPRAAELERDLAPGDYVVLRRSEGNITDIEVIVRDTRGAQGA